MAQLFLSSFLLRRFGVAATLLILPFVYLCSFSALALNASLQVMVVAVVIGRATGYGITVPAREVLFTVVDREDKYKSKSFIDTVVLRGSDAAAASTFTRIEVMGLRWLNLCLLPVVVLWIFVSWYLGRNGNAWQALIEVNHAIEAWKKELRIDWKRHVWLFRHERSNHVILMVLPKLIEKQFDVHVAAAVTYHPDVQTAVLV